LSRGWPQSLLIAAVAVLFAGAGYLYYQWREGDALDPVAIGRQVLALELPDVDGRRQVMAQWRGKVLVVNFWATWCAPCREEIPGFIESQKRYGSESVQFVGIAIDTPERIAPYAKEIGINYPLLVGRIDSMEFAKRAGDRSGVLPFTLVIGRDGKMLASEVGVLKPERLENLIKSLI
jgi:thiol-disulfide isomerase/thioredoxin